MKMYLVRHAIATPRETAGYHDDDRPLTKEGIAKISREAKGLARIAACPDILLTSPLSRARETANIIARALDAEQKIHLCQDLLPGGSRQKLVRYLAGLNHPESVMLVGHEPDLGLFGSYLLGATTSILSFKKGSVACINVPSLPPRTPGTLLWLLTPRHIRALG